MYPRQYDLTDNFFPRMPFGTNVFENTKTPNYAWIFTDSTTESNPYPTYQGANQYEVTANYARYLVHKYYTTTESLDV